MLEFFSRLLDGDFMPHGHCYRWEPAVLWLNVGSDTVIAIAYYMIPVALIYFVRARGDVRFGWVFWMFASFILLCGTSHFMDVYTTWYPVYRFEGIIKAATAAVSMATALALWPLLPRALALPGVPELERANAELARRNEDLELFAHVASHDLREPVRMIGSFVQALEERYGGEIDTEGRQFIQHAVEGAERLGHMLDSILVYSRAGHREMQWQTVGLNEVVRGAMDNLQMAIEDAEASIRVGDLPSVRGDRGMLIQVFQNLLHNALKFRGEEPARIEISFTTDDQDWCRIHVRDHGEGLRTSEAERAFAPFSRLRDRKEEAGDGIGLAVCRRIVERHGGKISIQDDARADTCVTVSLPAAQSV